MVSGGRILTPGEVIDYFRRRNVVFYAQDMLEHQLFAYLVFDDLAHYNRFVGEVLKAKRLALPLPKLPWSWSRTKRMLKYSFNETLKRVAHQLFQMLKPKL